MADERTEPPPIPYGRQSIDPSDLEAVADVLRSDFLTQGPAVPAFERKIADRCGAAHAVATSSATGALHIACLALGVGESDRVWTSPITFVASANCALYCGASVDFVDIDPESYNLSVERLEQKLGQAEADGTLPKVVIPVHLAGQPCDMKAIHALSKRFGFRIIEDASHAVGAEYQGRPIGDCRYSDIAIFSFHPVKIITTGEGGMALTNDPGLAERMALLRSHGITRDPAEMSGPPDGPWAYQQLELGFNYRMTDIQAALGSSQAERLDRFIARRREIAADYDEAFVNEPVTVPRQHPDSNSSWHLYIIRLPGADEARHRQVHESLRGDGIGVNLHYIPVYRQPFYRGLGFDAGYCPEAENYYREAITLPIHPRMTGGDQSRVVEAVRRAVRK